MAAETFDAASHAPGFVERGEKNQRYAARLHGFERIARSANSTNSSQRCAAESDWLEARERAV